MLIHSNPCVLHDECLNLFFQKLTFLPKCCLLLKRIFTAGEQVSDSSEVIQDFFLIGKFLVKIVHKGILDHLDIYRRGTAFFMFLVVLVTAPPNNSSFGCVGMKDYRTKPGTAVSAFDLGGKNMALLCLPDIPLRRSISP